MRAFQLIPLAFILILPAGCQTGGGNTRHVENSVSKWPFNTGDIHYQPVESPLPGRFLLTQSVEANFSGRQINLLCYFENNAQGGFFSLVCQKPEGLWLFSFRQNSGDETSYEFKSIDERQFLPVLNYLLRDFQSSYWSRDSLEMAYSSKNTGQSVEIEEIIQNKNMVSRSFSDLSGEKILTINYQYEENHMQDDKANHLALDTSSLEITGREYQIKVATLDKKGFLMVFLNALGVVCNLGGNKHEVLQALTENDCSHMKLQKGWLTDGSSARVGQVNQKYLSPLDAAYSNYDSRAAEILMAAVGQIDTQIRTAINKYGHHRVGVVLGTSTSGIESTERSLASLAQKNVWAEHYHYNQQRIGGLSALLAEYYQLTSIEYTISTACSSSAKSLVSARNLLNAGVCDAVIAGGADSLCQLTINGFASLGALSEDLSNPFSRNRKGINIGEAAAVFLMTRDSNDSEINDEISAPVILSGAGESSDAYHFSAPEPGGRGAIQSMKKALKDAAMQPGEIDYINLHGTGTVHNDLMESLAVNNVFGDKTAVSSTKTLTGHCLGAAGALEAAFSWLLLSSYNSESVLPAHLWDGVTDEALAPVHLFDETRPYPMQSILSNSFAFGGSNASLIFSKTAE